MINKARMEAVHARYRGPLSKLTGVFGRKESRQRSALERGAALQEELQQDLAERVADEVCTDFGEFLRFYLAGRIISIELVDKQVWAQMLKRSVSNAS